LNAAVVKPLGLKRLVNLLSDLSSGVLEKDGWHKTALESAWAPDDDAAVVVPCGRKRMV
jgi:hypothetical protein